MGKTFEEGKKYEFARVKEVPQTVVQTQAVPVASGVVEKSLDDCVILKGGVRVMRSSFDIAVEVKEDGGE